MTGADLPDGRANHARLCPVVLANRWGDVVLPSIVESELKRGKTANVVFDADGDLAEQSLLKGLVCGVVKGFTRDHPVKFVETLWSRILSEELQFELLHLTSDLHVTCLRPFKDAQPALVVVAPLTQDRVLSVKH